MTWAYTIETGTTDLPPLQETACWETTTTAENRVEFRYNRSPAVAYGGGGWNRYYDPALGAFTQTDKILEYSGGGYLTAIQHFPETYRNYVYAVANPIEYYDPNGLDSWSFRAGFGWYFGADIVTGDGFFDLKISVGKGAGFDVTWDPSDEASKCDDPARSRGFFAEAGANLPRCRVCSVSVRGQVGVAEYEYGDGLAPVLDPDIGIGLGTPYFGYGWFEQWRFGAD